MSASDTGCNTKKPEDTNDYIFWYMVPLDSTVIQEMREKKTGAKDNIKIFKRELKKWLGEKVETLEEE